MTSENEIVIRREFDLPPDKLFSVWTDRKHLENWLGPTSDIDVDLRPGGTWRCSMERPHDAGLRLRGVFTDIDRGERIVTTYELCDVGTGGPELPRGVVVTVLFHHIGEDRSVVNIRIAHPTADERQKHLATGVVSLCEAKFHRLDEYLKDLREK